MGYFSGIQLLLLHVCIKSGVKETGQGEDTVVVSQILIQLALSSSHANCPRCCGQVTARTYSAFSFPSSTYAQQSVAVDQETR